MALTIQGLLSRIDRSFQGNGDDVKHDWSHPFLRVVVCSSLFEGLDDDDREAAFAGKLELDISTLRSIANRGFVRWYLLGTSDTERFDAGEGTSWLDLLDPAFESRHPTASANESVPRYLHFYGFKGGQGRSTVLALLGRSLAEDGWRVLAVDFDSEAPSLDTILGARVGDVGATLVGVRAEEVFRPASLMSTSRGGELSLLAFRPDSASFDFDAAALAFELQVHAPTASRLSAAIQEHAQRYDILLIDHRTGLGSVVPQIVRALPGPIVVCSRLDGQSRHASRSMRALWSVPVGWPGMLVSLSPPDEDDESFRERTRSEAEDLLQGLADMHGVTEDSESRSPQEFEDHWIIWPFHSSLARLAQATDMVSPTHAQRLGEMRRLVNLGGRKAREIKKSGATDEGGLITTNALRKLQAPSSPFTLVVGRKGTGKTRLLRALVEAGLGSPLLVPGDFPDELGGVKAGNLAFKKLIERFRGQTEYLWYALIAAALETGTTKPEIILRNADEIGNDTQKILARLTAGTSKSAERQVLLVDALETAFDQADTFPFIKGLFRALEAVESTPELASSLQLRLFVRRDLVEKGIQNREQLEAGRRIDLVWDVQGIFNFALSRIALLEPYRLAFPEVTSEIKKEMPSILAARLPQDHCESILLRIFPNRLSYKNMSTLTFLRTYFSDDNEGRESFYPRVYQRFLEEVSSKTSAKSLVKGRVDGKHVIEAHQTAAHAFLEEVSQELAHAAGVEVAVLNKVFERLENRKTPFDIDELVALVAKGARLQSQEVRHIFDTMKQLGIFEEYPKRPNQWRPGRLFKSALRMRFLSGSDRI